MTLHAIDIMSVRFSVVLAVLFLSVSGRADVYDNLDDAIESEIDWSAIGGTDVGAIDTSLPITGESLVGADEMYVFVARQNPGFDREIARQYHDVGRIYGIRGDVAICQAIIETGWFRFGGGTAVAAGQHNYCGLGVTARGLKGAAFGSVRDGVAAHIQHLFAYATDAPLPDGEELVDPRFAYVRRATARSWRDLDMKWAMNRRYAESVIALYRRLLESAGKK